MARGTIRHIEVLFPGMEDAVTVPVTITFSADEQAFIGTVRTVPVTATPSVVEGLLAEVATIPVKITPSGVDVQVITEPPVEVYANVQPSFLEAGQWQLIETPLWYVDIQPTWLEITGREWTDALSAYVDVTSDWHDCFTHPTPNYVFTESTRWEAVEQSSRWNANESGSRWNAYEVAGPFDNSCP